MTDAGPTPRIFLQYASISSIESASTQQPEPSFQVIQYGVTIHSS